MRAYRNPHAIAAAQQGGHKHGHCGGFPEATRRGDQDFAFEFVQVKLVQVVGTVFLCKELK